jgi:16S rRNA (adenine1518-N6/adenine1519-N6)-dimethyltransferase
MNTHNIIARKRFGQHFLHDKNLLHKMISLIAPEAHEHFVEIGPGLGALTELLAPHVGILDLIEIDRDLAAILKEQYASDSRVKLHCADILSFELTNISQQPRSLRVVGNLPYNISSPLLFKCFEEKNIIQDMHFLLQKEVVDRITGEIGSADYGRLAVMSQYYCTPTALLDVPPEVFKPQPKVDSAFVRLVPLEQPPLLAHSTAMLSRVVKEAFTYRRKTLSNALKNLVEKRILLDLGINPTLRPQDISVVDFVRISNSLIIE